MVSTMMFQTTVEIFRAAHSLPVFRVRPIKRPWLKGVLVVLFATIIASLATASLF
jgi:hypothetical protein